MKAYGTEFDIDIVPLRRERESSVMLKQVWRFEARAIYEYIMILHGAFSNFRRGGSHALLTRLGLLGRPHETVRPRARSAA